MKRNGLTWKITIGVFIVTALTGCDASRTVALDDSRRAAIESEVESFLTDYRAAFNAGDADAIVGLYVADDRFALHEDGVLRYPTPQAIVQALAGLPEGTSMSTEGRVSGITVLADDLATASTTYRTKVALPDAGSFTIEGVMTALLEKSDAGWRVVQAHMSSVRERRGS